MSSGKLLERLHICSLVGIGHNNDDTPLCIFFHISPGTHACTTEHTGASFGLNNAAFLSLCKDSRVALESALFTMHSVGVHATRDTEGEECAVIVFVNPCRTCLLTVENRQQQYHTHTVSVGIVHGGSVRHGRRWTLLHL